MVRLLKDDALYKSWLNFLEENYKSEIETLAVRWPEKRSLYIDYDVLDKKNPELAEGLLNEPYKHIYNAEETFNEIDTSVGKIKVHIRIKNLPSICKYPIRKLRSEHMGKLISLEGLVKKHTKVKPDVRIAKFQCEKCGAIITEEQTEEILKEPSECYENQEGCGRVSSFKLLTAISGFIDKQKIELQENPEGLQAAEQPEKITVYLQDDLVGKIYPGDRIHVNGILHGMQKRRGAYQLTTFDFVLDACNFEIIESLYQEIDITKDDIKKIKTAAKDPLLYQKMKHSIAPTIYGMNREKEALTLQLFGGVPKKLADGTNIRGDIHILLSGDPGTAKSQILSSLSKRSPRSVFCTGKGASAAGLTAAAVRDEFGEGQWTLEAGALVLADGGIACVDEIDKMNDNDREALHPAMEQQEVNISKAGINATLKARTSILAAANPKYGRFDQYQPIQEQIDMAITLLSRFDLILIIIDKPNTKHDSELADHILTTSQNPDNKDIIPSYQPEFLSKYIAYAKQNIKPKLTDETKQKIKEFYLKMRNISNEAIAITPRQLEAIIRLAEASAKIRLSNIISIEDVGRAIAITEHYLKSVCVDFETGKPDISILTSGYSYSQQERMKAIVTIIRQVSSPDDKGSLKEDIIQEAEIIGIPIDKTEEAIEHLKQRSGLLEISPGRYRLNEM
jgi:replicative DNA helicase Mcm